MTNDGFHVQYPCYFLVPETGLVPDDDGHHRLTDPMQVIVSPDTQGTLTLFVFTDSDIAERFCDEGEVPDDVEIVTAIGRDFLAAVIEAAGSAGARMVAFDPVVKDGRASRVWPITYAAERIKKGMDLR